MKSVTEMLALVLDVDQECLHLKGLEEQELLPLFNKFAFHGRNPNNHKDLQRIGKDIVKKLWGSPLAAKVIGTLLNSRMDYSYWKRILKCDSLINLEGAKEVANILKLSYFHLPTDVQQFAKDVGSFLQFANALHGYSPAQLNCEASNISSRQTSSLLTESKVFSRDNEKAKVIEWLKKPASHAQISAFCIVGPGGLGKTTLAQLIYQEIESENHFDNIIWVCVSTSFNVEDITRKILENLGEKSNGRESLNGLHDSLKEKIHSKKVLIILDDVWNDDKLCDWEKLVAPLRFVQEGSKILLTTRMKSVAEMLGGVLDQECLHLKGLEEWDLLSLFNKFAFKGRNPNNHKDLQRIGKDIVKKLWGSPLAAKVIGTLLNSHMDYRYWKRILKCDSLINLEDAKEVTDILKCVHNL